MNSKNIHFRLYLRLKQSILNEYYPNNSQLPPVRKAALDFGVNPATVMKAYNLLENEGLIEKRGGSGCYVSYDPFAAEFSFDDELHRLDLHTDNKNSYDFASGSLSTELFPITDFKKCMVDVLDRDEGEAFHYQDPQGYPPLRETASRLLQREGLPITADTIQIVSGSQQALDLIVRTVLIKGDLVVMESPGYPGAISAFRKAGARIASLPLSHDGFEIEDLMAILNQSKIKLLYTSSTFQNPTGVSLAPEKKRELAQLAAQYDFYVIEDDCLSDLYYTETKAPLIKSFDQADHVIYIKSYSKIFMPGLRLGLMTVPAQLKTQLISAKFASDISNSGLNQRAIQLFIEEGMLATHSKKIRKEMKTRFETMKAAILKMKNAKLVFEPEGGLYFWLQVPQPDFDCQNLLSNSDGIDLQPGKMMSPNRQTAAFFRLSCAAVPTERIEAGIQKIDLLIQETL